MGSDRVTESQVSRRAALPRVPCVVGVLVGGAGRRMGYAKTLLTLPTGQTVVRHICDVARRLAPNVEETLILGRCKAMPSDLSELNVLRDAVPEAGPLAGLVSLLAHAADRWAMLLSCDMPLLDTPVLRRLLAEARSDVDAVAFVRSDQPRTYHACCALYHPRTLAVAQRELGHGKRSLQRVLAGVRTTALRPTTEEVRQLTNINTPADRERALGSEQQ